MFTRPDLSTRTDDMGLDDVEVYNTQPARVSKPSSAQIDTPGNAPRLMAM